MTSDALCHTFNSQQQINKYGEKVTTRPGGKYGLYLLINIEEYDHVLTLTNSSGILVLVHEPHVLPDINDKGFVVPAGTETLAVIKKTVVRHLPEPYAKPPNLCENTNAPGYKNPLKYFTHYSLSACRRECRISDQLSLCKCSAHYLGGNNVTFCSYPRLIDCADDALVLYDTNSSIQASCGCLPECEETIYDVSVSSTGMPNRYIKESLIKSLNVPQINASNIERNILSLNIFFGEMRYTLIEQHSVYTWLSLFGELGGQLGLCLGASVLTIAELLQLFQVLCAWWCKQSPKQNAPAEEVPANKSTIIDIHRYH